jgi:hypothetical protein
VERDAKEHGEAAEGIEIGAALRHAASQRGGDWRRIEMVSSWVTEGLGVSLQGADAARPFWP